MSYDQYKAEQISIINRIIDLDDKLEYLLVEQERFNSLNTNADATKIIYWFDTQIKITENKIKRYSAKRTIVRNKSVQNKKSSVDENITLLKLFKNVSDYKSIMEILVTENLCMPKTYVWIDDKNGNKGMLVSIIKRLHAFGYLKRRPSANEIVNISRNTFNIDIAVNTVYKVNPDNHMHDFIPPYSSK